MRSTDQYPIRRSIAPQSYAGGACCDSGVALLAVLQTVNPAHARTVGTHRRAPAIAARLRTGLRLVGRALLLALLALPLARSAAAATEAHGPQVRLETSLGNIVIELQPDQAPRSSANFLDYVKSGFYDGTVFHRVISGFMIQGGGMTPDLKQKSTRAPIQNEGSNGLKNVRGAIAMARTSDPDSATSQFFIDVVDNPALDYPGRDGHGEPGTVLSVPRRQRSAR